MVVMMAYGFLNTESKYMLTITEKAGRAPVEPKGGEVWMVQGERTL